MMEYAERIAYSTKETLYFTREMARRYNDQPGCYVECGCAAGAQIIAMRSGAPNKLIHAFDSFQGICLPSNKDDQMPGIKILTKQEQERLPDPGQQVLESSGATIVPIESFEEHLKNSGAGLENLQIHKGWFEETMPINEVGDIAILRLDGDLYNSTFVCLKYLFPKLINGGVCIVDDYELAGCKLACIEYFDFIGYDPEWKFVSNIAYFYK